MTHPIPYREAIAVSIVATASPVVQTALAMKRKFTRAAWYPSPSLSLAAAVCILDNWNFEALLYQFGDMGLGAQIL
jgi:hypothetical protein